MFELIDKKIITILRNFFVLNWPYAIYFNIIGIRKYVIKKVIYNIGNTIPWACYQQ